jgi:hypothetical protein
MDLADPFSQPSFHLASLSVSVHKWVQNFQLQDIRASEFLKQFCEVKKVMIDRCLKKPNLVKIALENQDLLKIQRSCRQDAKVCF